MDRYLARAGLGVVVPVGGRVVEELVDVREGNGGDRLERDIPDRELVEELRVVRVAVHELDALDVAQKGAQIDIIGVDRALGTAFDRQHIKQEFTEIVWGSRRKLAIVKPSSL